MPSLSRLSGPAVPIISCVKMICSGGCSTTFDWDTVDVRDVDDDEDDDVDDDGTLFDRISVVVDGLNVVFCC